MCTTPAANSVKPAPRKHLLRDVFLAVRRHASHPCSRMQSLPTAPLLRRSHFGRDFEADKLAAAALDRPSFGLGCVLRRERPCSSIAAQEPLCRRVGESHSIKSGTAQNDPNVALTARHAVLKPYPCGSVRLCDQKWLAKRSTPPKCIVRDTPPPYMRSRPTCNLSDQIVELGIESRRGLKQRRIFAGDHQRRWQVIDDRHALAILMLH